MNNVKINVKINTELKILVEILYNFKNSGAIHKIQKRAAINQKAATPPCPGYIIVSIIPVNFAVTEYSLKNKTFKITARTVNPV